ncbi:MAG: hypothetical protein LBK65_01120 [Tannerellaceae bacterium]|nr:hypothetical protein [Tannerellaceae bacterium]
MENEEKLLKKLRDHEAELISRFNEAAKGFMSDASMVNAYVVLNAVKSWADINNIIISLTEG